jgi:ligand-binding sensor domain-containing protein/signal transduction histidine kinase
MWFGTRDGLNKYDGYTFTVYKNSPEDSTTLSNNFVTSIIEDRKGGFWIGTWGGGLDYFNPEKQRFTHFKRDPHHNDNASGAFINVLMQDDQGKIWIGTDGGGLKVFDPGTGKFTNYMNDSRDPWSLSDNEVTCMLMDSRHQVWVGTTRGGLNLLDSAHNRFIHLQHDEKDGRSLSSNYVWKLFEDSHKNIWVATRGAGLNLMDQSQRTFRHFNHDPHNSNSLAHDVVFSLAEDDRENLWIGTENGGLSVLHLPTGAFYTYQHDDIDPASLSNNSIYSLYKDAQNNMWVGTYSGGANLYNKNANLFMHYVHSTDPDGLGHNNILHFCGGAGGLVWIATDGGGVDLFDPNKSTFKHFTHRPGDPNSICGNYILNVYKDAEDKIWMGSVMDGFSIYDPAKNTFRNIKKDPRNPGSISGNNIVGFAEDKDNDIWIAAYGDGLNLYDRKKGTYRHFLHDSANANSISSDKIICMLEDSKGYLWIGTFESGVDRYDKHTNTFTHYRHEEGRNSLSNNSIQHIYEDSHGNIWISTNVGLSMLDTKTDHFTVYSMKDGLPSDITFAVLEDIKGKIWVSTNGGLSRFDPAARTFNNFSTADGLQSNEFKGHACFKSASGALYFGGVNGFNIFFPDSIRTTPFDPALVITSFQIFNKEVPISSDQTSSPLQQSITDTKDIVLSYKSSVISFEFASLNYTVSRKKQYMYMLEGFDSKWNNIGSRRTATYTNLNPGSYVFKIKGLNNDGSWSGKITSLRLTITPPFWKTWWFRLMAILSVVSIAVTFHRVRMGIVKAQKKKLEHQVAVLLDKAVAQGKYEIASEVLHDIGNAVVGFGSHLTRVRRLLDNDDPDKLQKLAAFLKTQQPALSNVLGEPKSTALVTFLDGMAQQQGRQQEEMSSSITEQLQIVSRIQEILDIQRQYITGQDSRERKPINIRTVITDSLSMLYSAIDKQRIDVSLDLPEDQPVIKGDRTRLMQLVLNILKNSIEAIDIDAAVKTISLRLERTAGWLILQVRDSGKGFDPAIAAQLFERGFTTKASGAGVGLYNCRTIAESHEGIIDIVSDGPGKGSLVTVRFNL